MVWNPPWSTLIVIPLGLLPFAQAASVWIFCNLLFVGLAITFVWQKLTRPSDSNGFVLALAAGFLFSGTLDLIMNGQITTLVLMGLLLAIDLVRRGHDGWAGTALLLTAFKPHVTYVAVLIFLIWVTHRRRWRVLGGLAVAGIGSALILGLPYYWGV